MKLSERMNAEREYVASALAGLTLCDRCSCTLETYADSCNADLSDVCPGFMLIEETREKFNKAVLQRLDEGK